MRSAAKARPAVDHRLERLPGPHPPPLEPLLEAREDAGQQRRAADEQHVVHVVDAGLPVLEHRGEARVEAAVEAVPLEQLAELRAGEALQRRAEAGLPGAAAEPGRGDAEDGRLVEVDGFLDAAGLGQHQPPPEPGVLVALRVEGRVARLAAGLLQHPAVHGVATERPALLREDARLPAHRPAGRQGHQHDVHRAPADVHDEHRPLVGEAEAVAERRRHRLVHEPHPPHPQPLQEALHLGAVRLERRHRRGDDEVADALAGRVLRRDEQLAEEGPRHLAGGHGPPAEAREGPRGLARQRGLERRHEGRVRGLAVPLEGRPPDEGAAAEEHPAGDRGPAPEAVEDARLLQQVHRRRHHARGLERVVPLGVAADVGELHELRLARRLVPPGDPGVRGAEVERPAGHRGLAAPSSDSIVAVEAGRSRWSRRATSSARLITRRMFPLASLPRSSSLQPRRASSARSRG